MSNSKVALVTGANKGIGFAVVRAMCKQYAGDVYLTARDAGLGTAAVDSLKKEGLSPLFHQLDINDPNTTPICHWEILVSMQLNRELNTFTLLE